MKESLQIWLEQLSMTLALPSTQRAQQNICTAAFPDPI